MTVDSNSFLAIKSKSPHVSKALLTNHAEISQIDFPLVASTVKFDTYMDEIIKSQNSTSLLSTSQRTSKPYSRR
jgi:hypothetical protein